jgi:hypothetical protein
MENASGTTAVERRGSVIRKENVNSRVQKTGREALYITAIMVFLAGGFRPEFVQAALGAYTLIAGLVLGGGTWTNLKERDVAQARLASGGVSNGSG